jgi:hypothetical protein
MIRSIIIISCQRPTTTDYYVVVVPRSRPLPLLLFRLLRRLFFPIRLDLLQPLFLPLPFGRF